LERLISLSICQSAASSGGFSIQFQSIDAAFNQVLFNLPVTGIVTSMNENAVAFAAQTQLTIQLQQYGFLFTGQPQFTSNSTIDPNGFPVFSSQLGLALWRVNISENVLTFFSECDYEISLINDSTGILYKISETPLLCTLAEAQNEGPINGLVLTDVNGTPLTNTQIISLIEIASSRLISMLNNRIVMTCRVHEEAGYWQRSFFLRESIPGLWFDGVWAKRPYTFSLFGIFLGGSASVMWNYIRRTGELQYIPSQNAYYSYEPSSFGNEIKISYVGGNYKIPVTVQAALYRLMSAILENNAGISSLQDGSWKVTFKDTPLIDQIRGELSEYVILN
jgi:hypothetical protein